jgi:predicted AAA+ superfamily ATPase
MKKDCNYSASLEIIDKLCKTLDRDLAEYIPEKRAEISKNCIKKYKKAVKNAFSLFTINQKHGKLSDDFEEAHNDTGKDDTGNFAWMLCFNGK